jgi:hypothetical protein
LLRLCLDIVLHVCSLSSSRREPFFRLASLEQSVVLDRRVIAFTNVFILHLPLKTLYKIQNLNCNKV